MEHTANNRRFLADEGMTVPHTDSVTEKASADVPSVSQLSANASALHPRSTSHLRHEPSNGRSRASLEELTTVSADTNTVLDQRLSVSRWTEVAPALLPPPPPPEGAAAAGVVLTPPRSSALLSAANVTAEANTASSSHSPSASAPVHSPLSSRTPHSVSVHTPLSASRSAVLSVTPTLKDTSSSEQRSALLSILTATSVRSPSWYVAPPSTSTNFSKPVRGAHGGERPSLPPSSAYFESSGVRTASDITSFNSRVVTMASESEGNGQMQHLRCVVELIGGEAEPYRRPLSWSDKTSSSSSSGSSPTSTSVAVDVESETPIQRSVALSASEADEHRKQRTSISVSSQAERAMLLTSPSLIAAVAAPVEAGVSSINGQPYTLTSTSSSYSTSSSSDKSVCSAPNVTREGGNSHEGVKKNAEHTAQRKREDSSSSRVKQPALTAARIDTGASAKTLKQETALTLPVTSCETAQDVKSSDLITSVPPPPRASEADSTAKSHRHHRSRKDGVKDLKASYSIDSSDSSTSFSRHDHSSSRTSPLYYTSSSTTETEKEGETESRNDRSSTAQPDHDDDDRSGIRNAYDERQTDGRHRGHRVSKTKAKCTASRAAMREVGGDVEEVHDDTSRGKKRGPSRVPPPPQRRVPSPKVQDQSDALSERDRRHPTNEELLMGLRGALLSHGIQSKRNAMHDTQTAAEMVNTMLQPPQQPHRKRSGQKKRDSQHSRHRHDGIDNRTASDAIFYSRYSANTENDRSTVGSSVSSSYCSTCGYYGSGCSCCSCGDDSSAASSTVSYASASDRGCGMSCGCPTNCSCRSCSEMGHRGSETTEVCSCSCDSCTAAREEARAARRAQRGAPPFSQYSPDRDVFVDALTKLVQVPQLLHLPVHHPPEPPQLSTDGEEQQSPGDALPPVAVEASSGVEETKLEECKAIAEIASPAQWREDEGTQTALSYTLRLSEVEGGGMCVLHAVGTQTEDVKDWPPTPEWQRGIEQREAALLTEVQTLQHSLRLLQQSYENAMTQSEARVAEEAERRLARAPVDRACSPVCTLLEVASAARKEHCTEWSIRLPCAGTQTERRESAEEAALRVHGEWVLLMEQQAAYQSSALAEAEAQQRMWLQELEESIRQDYIANTFSALRKQHELARLQHVQLTAEFVVRSTRQALQSQLERLQQQEMVSRTEVSLAEERERRNVCEVPFHKAALRHSESVHRIAHEHDAERVRTLEEALANAETENANALQRERDLRLQLLNALRLPTTTVVQHSTVATSLTVEDECDLPVHRRFARAHQEAVKAVRAQQRCA